jgi:hypothetical protein
MQVGIGIFQASRSISITLAKVNVLPDNAMHGAEEANIEAHFREVVNITLYSK